MIHWVFRGIFVLIVFGVLFVHLTSVDVSDDRAAFWAIIWGGLAFAAIAFLIDLFTPKKSLAALAGVFFGLLVGIFISWALSPVVDMINDIYPIFGFEATAIQAIKLVMGVCICYLVIGIVIRTKDVFTKNCNGRLVTTDYNLSKVAQVREVDVLNINDLASSLRTVALPGEPMVVKIIKPGEEAEQGVGYLEDGTMVVVEGARNKIGRDVMISITSSLQTSAGKMIFGKFEGYSQKPAEPRGRAGVRNHDSKPVSEPQQS